MTPALLVERSHFGDSSQYLSFQGVTSASSHASSYVSLGADSATVQNEREWETAFASARFTALVAEARQQIAGGQTKPMILGDL